MVCRCHQLQQIVPHGLARWVGVLSQPWEGDVTMVLPSAYSQIKKAVTNPTPEDLQIACLQVLQACFHSLTSCPYTCQQAVLQPSRTLYNMAVRSS